MIWKPGDLPTQHSHPQVIGIIIWTYLLEMALIKGEQVCYGRL